MYYIDDIEAFTPKCAQEQADRALMLAQARRAPRLLLTRQSKLAHITASSMIFNAERDCVLMAYHNIYRSWAWTGGHADGECDLINVAMNEAREETGVRALKPIMNAAASLEIIPVPAHIKRGAFVSAHLHMNVSYLFIGDMQEALRVKADENSGVRWIPINKLPEYVSETDMLPIYDKLINRARG